MKAAPIALDEARVAVTGGARGIGRATAAAFAARGAQVVTGDLDGGDHELDVTDRESFAAFLDAAGPIDVLVNNAGVMPAGPFLAEPDEVSAASMAVNLWGPLLGMKLALPGMLERRRGHIVNVCSLAGRLPIPGLAVYVASKHAAVGLSATVREEIRGSSVTVTAVMPTAVHTRLSAGIPLGGLFAVEPEDVASAIVGSLDKRPATVTVPRVLGAAPALIALTPEPLMRAFRRLIDGDRALTSRDEAVRAEYEESIARQTPGRT